MGPLAEASPALTAFWTERHLATLTTLRPDGTPHVVPVGVTVDFEAGLARVICSVGSRKARNVAASSARAAPAACVACGVAEEEAPGSVAVCQVDGRRWSTLEGSAVIRSDRASVADAERRYALRYRAPRENPDRVVIEIAVRRVLGGQ